jgi:hypothetical protein
MQRPWFRQGIQQLINVASEHITVILCSEAALPYATVTTSSLHTVGQLSEGDVQHIQKDGSLIDARSIPFIETLQNDKQNQRRQLQNG